MVNNSISNGTLPDLRLFLDSGDRGKLLSGQFTAEGTRDRNSDGGGTDNCGTIMVETQSAAFAGVPAVRQRRLRGSTLLDLTFANVNDPTWYAGARWQNAKDAYVQLTYGHKQGVNSFQGDTHYPITPLTAAFANYGETVTTPQQQIMNNLNQGQLSPTNVVINPQTGLPEALIVTRLALQNTICAITTSAAAS